MKLNSQVTLLVDKIEQVKSNQYISSHDGYLAVNAYFANIVCAVSNVYPDVTLNEMQPITKVLEAFNQEYFNKDLTKQRERLNNE
ncbi:MAG: hypothetical protein ACI35O_08130 [Bacillaceae bacterium]